MDLLNRVASEGGGELNNRCGSRRRSELAYILLLHIIPTHNDNASHSRHSSGRLRDRRLIGAGGMEEVYRARDTRLNRDIALKILPDAFTHDLDRLARSKREAQIL